MTTTFFDSVKENDSSNRPKTDYLKLQEGDNKMLILSNPVHFRMAFNVGIVYAGADYNDISASRYLCYAKDLKSGSIKQFELSHTVAKQLLTLAEGYYTKYDSFPMPYPVNIKAIGAGKPTVKYSVIALEPIPLSEEDKAELDALDSAEVIVERRKEWQKKELETNPEYAAKAKSVIEATRESRAAAKKDSGTSTEEIATVSYDDLEGDDLEGLDIEEDNG